MGHTEFLTHVLILVVQVKIGLSVHVPQSGDDQRAAVVLVVAHQQDALLVKAVGQRVVIQAVLLQPIAVGAQVIRREHHLKIVRNAHGRADIAEGICFG